LRFGRGGGMSTMIFSQSASGKSGLAIRSSLTASDTTQRMGRYHNALFRKRWFC
jgi:hypothetical protein